MPATYLFDKNYENKKRLKLNEINEFLSLEENKKYKDIILDAKSFNKTFFEIKSPKTLNVNLTFEVDKNNIHVLVYRIKNIKEKEAIDTNKKHQVFIDGKVFFWGKGKWSYDLTIKDDEDVKRISHLGFAKRLNIASDESTSGYVFLLDKETEEYWSLSEKFFEEWSPMLKLASKMSLGEHGAVKIKWVSDFYDGPLSGYAVYKDRLHFFSLIEEQSYSGKRMYGVYELCLLNRVRCYFRHFLWEVVIQMLPNKIRGKMWYGLLGPLTKINEKNLPKNKVAGYFVY